MPTNSSTMAETKTVTTRSVNLNGAVFDFVEGVSSRGEAKGQPFLKLSEKSFDAPALVRLFTAAGIGPAISLAVKAFNKTIADATADAYTETTAPDGKKSYAFDASKAAKGIVDAIAGSISSAKEEIENQLADLRKQQEEVMDKVLPNLAKGIMPDGATVAKLSTLKIQIGQLEAKLVKKARKPKTDTSAPAPAK